MGGDSKKYICVEKDEAFHIQVKVENPHDRDTYGAVLWLDGQKVHGKKTFNTKTTFPGFKLGAGKYLEFKFAVPPLSGEA